MKQLIIDRQILSQKNITDEMTELEKLEQQNMLAEHFETLRTYEFSPSLQAQGFISPKAEQIALLSRKSLMYSKGVTI